MRKIQDLDKFMIENDTLLSMRKPTPMTGLSRTVYERGCNLDRGRFHEVAANDKNYNGVIIPVWQGSRKLLG